MSKSACDVFALVINFLKFNWKPKYVIILRLFEASSTTRQALAKKLTDFLVEYGLRNKITYKLTIS
jgi:hypothetical protein